MDIFTLNPHNFSHFGETGGHNMDFCGIREASKKCLVCIGREGRSSSSEILSFILYSHISKIGFYRADFTPS